MTSNPIEKVSCEQSWAHKNLNDEPRFGCGPQTGPAHKSRPAVLLVSYYFPPQNTVAVLRILRFARNLPAFGWRPVILACSPSPEQDPTPLDFELGRDVCDTTSVTRTALVRWEDRVKLIARKWLHRFWHPDQRDALSSMNVAPGPAPSTPQAYSSSFRAAIVERLFATPDDKIGWKLTAVPAGLDLIDRYQIRVIVSSGPPFTSHLVAATIAARRHIPLVLDFRDPWTRSPWGARNRSGWVRRKCERLERHVVQKAQRVVLNTPAMEQEFRDFYAELPEQKFVTITNGVDFAGSPRPVETLATTSPLRYIHAGSLYNKRAAMPLVEAFVEVLGKFPTASLDLVGDCEQATLVREKLKSSKFRDQIRLLPRIPHSEAAKLIQAASVLLLYQPGTGLQIPGKFFELLTERKPILAIVEPGDVSNIITEYGLGVTAQPGNLADMQRAFVEVAERWHQISSTGRWDEVIQRFDGKQLTGMLAQVLQDACCNSTDQTR